VAGAVAGLTILPWGAMRLVRHLTAWRLHSRHTHRAEVTRFIERTTDATKSGYINRLTLLRHYDVRDQLRHLEPPVLFLAAEEDHLVPSVVQARDMAERTPEATLRILEGHGHICLIAPDLDLSAIVTEWRAGGQ
jgi:pimeloyl-ACP methyl ester carboxylesterase